MKTLAKTLGLAALGCASIALAFLWAMNVHDLGQRIERMALLAFQIGPAVVFVSCGALALHLAWQCARGDCE